MKGAGYVISPLVGGAIVARSHFSAIFLVSAGVGIVALMFTLLLPPAPRPTVGAFDDDDDFSWRSFGVVFREPRLLPWYGVTVINMFFVGILFGFLPVRAHALGLSPLGSGLLLSAVSLSYLLIQPLAGKIADRSGADRTVRIGLLIAGLGVILMPFVHGPTLVVTAIIAGIGVGTVWTNTDTLISTLAREGRVGATMGAAGSFKEFGDMVGPLLIGVISQAFGLTVGFVSCGILGLAFLAVLPRQRAGAS